MHNYRVAIVGGGPGGLMTAHALQSRAHTPIDVTIFEAADRFGGKVSTGTFTRRPARYEAGAAEFYDYSAVGPDPLKELVLGLGLPIIPMGGSSLVMNGRLLSNGDDVRDVLGPAAALALTRFDRLARDVRGPRDFYFGEAVPQETHFTDGFDDLLAAMGHPAARRYVEQLTHSDLATEPPLTTVTYGLDNYLMNNPAYMSLYAIEGGNEQLMARLDGRLHVRRRLGHRVTHVTPAATRRLRVTAQHAAGVIDDDFDAVVMALPLDHLKRVEFAGPRLDAAMRRHIAHHDHPAHYLRVTLLFDRPFWRRHLRDSFCMLDSFGGCCLYDESSREPGAVHGTLGWLLGGDAAVEMSLLDDDELAAAVLDSLPDMIRHGRHAPLETRVHRWIGGVSAIPGGRKALSLDLRHQPEPVDHPGLFLVGDYLFDSTLNGVLDSAEYVAGWIADLTSARQSAVA